MKIKIVSSNCRSKTEIGVYAQDLPGGVPTPASSSPGGPGGATRALHRCWRGNGNNQRLEAEDKTSRRENPAPLKDVKNEDRSGNVYENKGPHDNLPDRKGDICAWLHAILYRNTRILQEPSSFCHVSSAGKRTGGSKMWKL